MGLPRKVAVYDSSGELFMAYDCERNIYFAECDVCRASHRRTGVGEAVLHAPCDASIVVDAGVYVENIVVSKNLSIYRCGGNLLPNDRGISLTRRRSKRWWLLRGQEGGGSLPSPTGRAPAAGSVLLSVTQQPVVTL